MVFFLKKIVLLGIMMLFMLYYLRQIFQNLKNLNFNPNKQGLWIKNLNLSWCPNLIKILVFIHFLICIKLLFTALVILKRPLIYYQILIPVLLLLFCLISKFTILERDKTMSKTLLLSYMPHLINLIQNSKTFCKSNFCLIRML